MSQEIICECGHKNPEGTILCEACGKPLQEDNPKQLLNMRYEGSARRSQTYNRTAIDKIWNYLSSVKVGVTLIILVLIAIAIGTIFPQNIYIPAGADPDTFYKDQYGVLGQIYKTLGFDNLYKSWWFIILIGLLGASIVVASLDRFFPLHRALKNQKVTRHERFMKKQRLFGTTPTTKGEEQLQKAEQALKEKKYKVSREKGALLAEKGRFSRWGPYVNHIGLMVVLIAAVLRFIPGMYVNETMWIREGETKALPGTHNEYYITNHKFILTTYNKQDPQYKQAIKENGSIVKSYQSDVTLFKPEGQSVLGATPKLKKLRDDQIKVNSPLEFAGYQVFQADYRLNELYKMNFTLTDQSEKKTFGKLSVNLYNPKENYDLGHGYKVKLTYYFPDFYFDDNGDPATKSDTPNNPAFIFDVTTPDKPKGETSFVAIKTNQAISKDNQYKLTFAGLDTRNVSGLIVKRDFTVWIFFVGAMIFLLGVVQGMYWQHRRIWLRKINGELWLSAHTNKNWHGIKKDIAYLTDSLGIPEPVDQLEQKVVTEERRKHS
ncbi:cytochrome c biogenesis protein ResB [Pullulanibacillus camelliae]|uniref:Cytochrome c biogenesis protein ResB n=1 Tax=Pullulanibacillus camelliae TaxID=1707096 RepID=A0A8J2VXB3_9BACL|nr:cytochrome c biogenesis protein ResB [Pullulanibacillus camelliae]GGE38429.1 cytochrome c biogenesis protein ResB [Pullulanibacillus camelliae]